MRSLDSFEPDGAVPLASAVAPSPQVGEVAADRSSVSPPKHSRAWVAPAATAVLTSLLVVGVWWQFELVSSALREVRNVSSGWMIAVVALTVVEALCRAGVFRSSAFTLTWPQAFALNETALASSNGLPAGAAIGVALRHSMGRSFGQTTAESTVSYLAVGEAFAIGRWLPMLAVAVADLIVNNGGWWDIGVVAVCIGAMCVSAIGMVILCTTCWVHRTWLWCATAVQRLIGRKIGCVRRWDLHGYVDGLRDVARPLLVSKALTLTLWGIASQILNGLMLLAALRGVGVGGEITGIEFWKAFLLVKTISRFAPTPGNVGAVEVGLTAALVAAGAPKAPALAGVLVFRAFTLVLPIVIGSISYLLWRRWARRSTRAASAAAVVPSVASRGRATAELTIDDVVVARREQWCEANDALSVATASDGQLFDVARLGAVDITAPISVQRPAPV
jgi:putative heme transporter